MSRCLAGILGCLWVFAALPAQAEEKPPLKIPQHRITYENLLGGRLNPLGVEDNFQLAYKLRFYESDSLALRENYVGIIVNPTLSPAISRFGGGVEIRPLTILSLYAGFYQAGYLGSFGTLQSFEDGRADFSDTTQDERKDRGENHPSSGYEVQMRATALAKVGPVAFRSDTNAYYSDIDLQGDDKAYYYQRLDLLAPNKGIMLASDQDVAYVTDFGLIAGARFTVSQSFFAEEDVGDRDLTTMRLGPTLLYSFFDEPGARFNKPTLIAITQWWLSHPYRTGADTSQAIPYFAAAFRFEGELFRAD